MYYPKVAQNGQPTRQSLALGYSEGTIPYHTTPYHTTPHHTTPSHTTPYRIIPYTTQHNTIPDCWLLTAISLPQPPPLTTRSGLQEVARVFEGMLGSPIGQSIASTAAMRGFGQPLHGTLPLNPQDVSSSSNADLSANIATTAAPFALQDTGPRSEAGPEPIDAGPSSGPPADPRITGHRPDPTPDAEEEGMDPYTSALKARARGDAAPPPAYVPHTPFQPPRIHYSDPEPYPQPYDPGPRYSDREEYGYHYNGPAHRPRGPFTNTQPPGYGGPHRPYARPEYPAPHPFGKGRGPAPWAYGKGDGKGKGYGPGKGTFKGKGAGKGKGPGAPYPGGAPGFAPNWHHPGRAPAPDYPPAAEPDPVPNGGARGKWIWVPRRQEPDPPPPTYRHLEPPPGADAPANAFPGPQGTSPPPYSAPSLPSGPGVAPDYVQSLLQKIAPGKGAKGGMSAPPAQEPGGTLKRKRGA